jgi:tRNA/rRNA methyltransferase
MTSSWVKNSSVVLVEPSEALNIGSVSRAMLNFGFEDLRIISSDVVNVERARVTACGATQPLENLRLFGTLSEALSDRQHVVGLSARDGKNRGSVLSLAEWLDYLTKQPLSRLAVIFGPEDNGLRQEHIEQCSYLVHIPTSDLYRSINLAHAVILVLYGIAQLTQVSDKANDLAEWDQYQQLDKLIEKVAINSGFYHVGTPQPLPSIVKTLFRRLSLTEREMSILLGLFGTSARKLEKM